VDVCSGVGRCFQGAGGGARGSGSAAGPTVYQGTLLQGKTLPVNLKKGPVWIRIGDPSNIEVRLGGKLVHGLPTQVGNVLLTRRGIRQA